MIPKNIKREHVLRAIDLIDKFGVPKGRLSKKFYLIYKGKKYPPKYVISLANEFANGYKLSPKEFSGGRETNTFLRRLGFKIEEEVSLKKMKVRVRKKKDVRKVKHNERCPKCKKTIEEMLRKIYGEVKVNYRFDVGTKPEDFKKSPFYPSLKKIFIKLQGSRGYKDFVRSDKLPPVDYYVPSPGLILEFDESQHFSKARKISLENYPKELNLGFDKSRWIKLCEEINAKDNDPPYRDEQRAWYDTLRDFLPTILNLKPIVRLFARDYIWCSLNPDNPKDIKNFRK